MTLPWLYQYIRSLEMKLIACSCFIGMIYFGLGLREANEEISIYNEALQECKDEPIVDKIIDKIRKERGE